MRFTRTSENVTTTTRTTTVERTVDREITVRGARDQAHALEILARQGITVSADAQITHTRG